MAARSVFSGVSCLETAVENGKMSSSGTEPPWERRRRKEMAKKMTGILAGVMASDGEDDLVVRGRR